MKRYRVVVARDRTEICEVEVDAAGRKEAAQKAFQVCRLPNQVSWQLSPATFAFYVPDGGIQELGPTSS